MDHDSFVRTVQDRSRLDSSEEAKAAAEATLRVLSQRITHGQAEAIAAELPEGFKDTMREADSTEDAEEFSPDEFVERVAERERVTGGLDPDDARRHTEAVLTALRDELDEETWTDATSQLPAEFDRLYETPT
ncbi:DUF2267 domain-containing protein [Haloferacaceae archaeon DSL9]